MSEESPERTLALSYAPARGRAALAALFALDDALARLLRTTREPALGQLRLAWWRDALGRLDTAPPPAEPVLAALSADLLPLGVAGASLTPIVDGWEMLAGAEQFDEAAVRGFAEGRGALFEAAAHALDAQRDPTGAAGQGWAAADLARHLADAKEADIARSFARPLVARAASHRWSRNGRALGALVHLARRNLELPHGAPVPEGSPGRVARLLWHRLTGC